MFLKKIYNVYWSKLVAVRFSIDNKGTLSHLDKMSKIPKQLIKEAAVYFIDITPFKTGNAKSHTYLGGDVIRADYPYAGRLDDGYSRQAPKGMVEPTVQFIDEKLKQKVEKL